MKKEIKGRRKNKTNKTKSKTNKNIKKRIPERKNITNNK